MVGTSSKHFLKSFPCLSKCLLESLSNSRDFIFEVGGLREREKLIHEFVYKIFPSQDRIKRFYIVPNSSGPPSEYENIMSLITSFVTSLNFKVEELGDRLVRAATTASSLEAELDSGNITKTQSKETPNEPSSQGTNSGGGPRVESSGDEESLGEDASKQERRIDAIDVDEKITLVSSTNNEMFDVDVLDVIEEGEPVNSRGAGASFTETGKATLAGGEKNSSNTGERKRRKGQNQNKNRQKREAWKSPAKSKSSHSQESRKEKKIQSQGTKYANPRSCIYSRIKTMAECAIYSKMYLRGSNCQDYCCSNRSLVDKILCDLNKAPDLPHLHTFSSNQCHCFHCKDVLGDGEICQRCTCMTWGSGLSKGLCLICKHNQNSLNDSPSISKNSSQSPLHINHHCCCECGDPLEGIFCRQCTCKLCGNGTHYGYDCPPKVSILPNPKPFHNQTIKELPLTVPSFDSKSNLVHDYSTVFDPPPQLPLISCEFCGNDARYGHYCTPQVPFFYPEQCYNQDFNFPQEFQGFHDFQQQDLCCENGGVTHEAYHPFIQKEEEEKQIEEDQAANARYWKIPACYDDYALAITPNKPDYSLSMGDEHPDTISVTKSDEFIKFSVENLVPIPSKSEGESKCDVPTREEITTFLNILFDADYESDSSDDQSYSNEDVPKKIFLTPLFDEEIVPIKIDQHHDNVESDLIESPCTHDFSLIISSKIDSLLDEFVDELALLKSIPLGIDETDCDFEEDIRLIEKLLYDNSSPRPPEEFVSVNFDAKIGSFSPSSIPVKDSDSLIEEIDLSFTPDYPMPPGIEDNDYDSERDILILKDLPRNDTLSISKIESFHFDIPSFSRPPAKPPDGRKTRPQFPDGCLWREILAGTFFYPCRGCVGSIGGATHGVRYFDNSLEYAQMEQSYIDEYSRMYKLDLEPLSSKLRKNGKAHIDYLKKAKEHADALRDIVEQARAQLPLDNALEFIQAVDPSRDWFSSQPHAYFVSEMIAVFGNQMICLNKLEGIKLAGTGPYQFGGIFWCTGATVVEFECKRESIFGGFTSSVPMMPPLVSEVVVAAVVVKVEDSNRHFTVNIESI
nr:hypothetical protein [Tanacetum cinerariifolium]